MYWVTFNKYINIEKSHLQSGFQENKMVQRINWQVLVLEICKQQLYADDRLIYLLWSKFNFSVVLFKAMEDIKKIYWSLRAYFTYLQSYTYI